MKTAILTLVLCLTPSLVAHAGLIIAGTHKLQPNTPDQIIDILVTPSSPGEIAPGLNFNVVIDDGGSIIGGSDTSSPVIQSINLKPTGGLFSNLPNAQTDLLVSPKLWQTSIVALTIPNRPAINGPTLLAQLTIDTTGFQSGNWVIDLDGDNGIGFPTTDLTDLPSTVTNGSFSIASVPEPASLALLGCLLPLSRLYRSRTRP